MTGTADHQHPDPHATATLHVPTTSAPVAAAEQGRRLRLGFLTHLDHTDELPRVYDENLQLISELERLGYDSAWIAVRHFHAGWAGTPTPFAFLGAAAARTSTIALGTAVFPLLADDPVRAAEEAGVLDHLTHGRLLLGLGKGVAPETYSVFTKWGADREVDYTTKVEQFRDGLTGVPLPGSGTVLWPQATELTGRLLQGTSTWQSVRDAARRGEGFLLERFGKDDERRPDGRPQLHRRQANSVLEYRSAFAEQWGDQRTPYVALSRSAWPGGSAEEALAESAAATQHWHDFAVKVGRGLAGHTPSERLLSDNFVWGTPEQIAADLLADPTTILSDELVIGLHPGRYTLDLAVEKAQTLLEEVYPIVAEGWLQARDRVEELVSLWPRTRADSDEERIADDLMARFEQRQGEFLDERVRA